ncbi:MAG TPA: phenylalanine--tRNA ligase subunit beta [Pyrinomonadaceae bacterium]|jgi:phenylalanyl-tRNA synthetase beta chain|nr:phenylalanine--tRNA ligase subunit beta [Pyrinomonadaceae bacterium]
MLISYNWLKELTATKLSPDEVRDRLTNVGLAVDAVESRGDDSVLDVEVPSNRGDCLSHIGIARELAVSDNAKLEVPTSEVTNTNGRTSEFTAVEIRDPDLCPRYAARVVRGVKIAPSPEWLTRKLEAIGQRPINNVADITNYVLHEMGQPLHAFDLAKLDENRIVVRRAAPGEKITTLDGIERELDKEMLVIADARKPVAVAGVMGGEESEISNSTADVLIESAYFNPASVRRTARKLGLQTEASHRFERNTDPDGVLLAQQRCVALICEIAGGVATADTLDVYPKRFESKVSLRPAQVEAITSLKVDETEMKRILTGLGFTETSEGGPALTYQVPSWRHDVAIEADLVEEIARHTGYDNIKLALPPAQSAGEYHPAETRKRKLRRALAALGYDEAISFSFIEATREFESIPAFRQQQDAITLSNPIIEEASSMRQTLLPGLLNSIRHNLNQGIRDICLFETGRAFAASPDRQLPQEREVLALAATGGAMEAERAEPARQMDFFDVKGALEAAVDAMNLPPLTFAAADVKHLRAGQSAIIRAGDVEVGTIGRLEEAITGSYKFRQPVYVAELDLSAMFEMPERPVLYSRLPRFPAIVRDVSLLVDRSVSVGQLIGAAEAQRTDYFAGVSFVGTYEGEGIADDKRSATLRFEYRADERTLRDEEVDAVHWPIVEALKEKFGAEIR